MSAKVELPAVDGTTGVLLDGEPAVATKSGDHWILTDEVSSSVTVEVI